MKKRQAVRALELAPNVHILGQPKPRIMKPKHDWHWLKEIPGPTHTPGGIEIPENKRVAECEIVASGPGRANGLGNIEPMVGKPGERVLFEGQSKVFIVDGQAIHCIRDVQVIGAIEKAPADAREEAAS